MRSIDAVSGRPLPQGKTNILPFKPAHCTDAVGYHEDRYRSTRLDPIHPDRLLLLAKEIDLRSVPWPQYLFERNLLA